jgi:hypothetical protein
MTASERESGRSVLPCAPGLDSNRNFHNGSRVWLRNELTCRGRRMDAKPRETRRRPDQVQRVVIRGLLPNNKADNDQHDACYQSAESDPSVHLASCSSETEVQPLTVPQQETDRRIYESKEP